MSLAVAATWQDVFVITQGFDAFADRTMEMTEFFAKSGIPAPEEVDGWVEEDLDFQHVKDARARAFMRRAFRNASRAVDAAVGNSKSHGSAVVSACEGRAQWLQQRRAVGAALDARARALMPLTPPPECLKTHVGSDKKKRKGRRRVVEEGYEDTYHLLHAASSGCLRCVKYWVETKGLNIRLIVILN